MLNDDYDGEFDFVVIGMGMAGSLATLKLLGLPDYSVLCLDRGETPLDEKTSTSGGASCDKLHLGPHYAGDLPTALQCLEDSLAFARSFPQHILGEPGSHWRNVLYFMMSKSVITKDEFIKCCDALRQRYSDLYQRSPHNRIFGPPEDFYKEIPPHSYEKFVQEQIAVTRENGLITEENVVYAVKTPEVQLNIRTFREMIEAKIKNSNVTFRGKSEVINIAFDPYDLGYIVTVRDTNGENTSLKKYRTKFVLNCSWESTAKLAAGVGYHAPVDGNREIIRIKASLLVKLPDSLKHVNTHIYFLGPYCSFTNRGDGTAIITCEPDTNLGSFFAGTEITDKRIKEIVANNLSVSEGEGKKIAENIMAGACKFIKDLSEAEVIKVRVGFVKMFNHGLDHSIYKGLGDTSIHLRAEFGAELDRGAGYIEISAKKTSFAQQVSMVINRIITVHLVILASLQDIRTILYNKIQDILRAQAPTKISDHAVANQIALACVNKLGVDVHGAYIKDDPTTTLPELADQLSDQIVNVMVAKQEVHSGLLQFFKQPKLRPVPPRTTSELFPTLSDDLVASSAPKPI